MPIAIEFGQFVCRQNLHSFYDTEEMGDMDLREFLLSMMNFVDVSALGDTAIDDVSCYAMCVYVCMYVCMYQVRKDERVAFSFTMFDEAKTGFISQRYALILYLSIYLSIYLSSIVR